MDSRIFYHASFPNGVKVVSKTHEGILNNGLDLAHFHAKWGGTNGEKVEPTKTDPFAGFFPTLESVIERETRGTDAEPRDALPNIRKGMTGHVKVIKLTPGKHIFRFAQHNDDSNKPRTVPLADRAAKAVDVGPFCGPWWTSSLGFENMLARVSATYENSAIGVANGRGMRLRDYARSYSAVFTDWSRMEIIGMCRVLRPIYCFMGMGAKLVRTDVKKTDVRGIELLETETYEDANVQLYIPNLWGHIGEYLSHPDVWTPERVDALLSRRVQDMRKAGLLLSTRKRFIIDMLMSR